MAYTICVKKGGREKRDRVLSELMARVERSMFRATLTAMGEDSIRVKPVRLKVAKPYCGNHPGECQVSPFTGPTKKPNAKWLEWNDWVQFHKLINAVLNRLRVDADVWSNPADVRGKMWIRKGRFPRVRWDWTETHTSYGRPIRTWNQGTEDQFKQSIHQKEAT